MDSWIQGSALSPDGKRLALASSRGLHVYTLETTVLLELAAKRLVRPLTDEECSRFFFGQQCPRSA